MLSLSTFSARSRSSARSWTRRPPARPCSDEVGTGTSPARERDGAAAGAPRRRRAGADARRAAGLTLATTHHGELKALKYEHPGGVPENAAVEFDEAEARAHVRLLWGSRGGRARCKSPSASGWTRR